MREIVLYEKHEDGVATITMNRPDRMNAINKELVEDLKAAFQQAAKDQQVRAIILTGAGRAFCAGADLMMIDGTLDPAGGRELALSVSSVTKLIFNLEKPVIASVNGYAMGGGLEYAMACDFLVASSEAKFSQATIKVGLPPDLGATYLLPRAVGVQKAKDLIFTGKSIDAYEAERIGLAYKVTDHHSLRDEVFSFAKELAQGPSVAIGFAKSLINRNRNKSLEEVLENEAMAIAICNQTADHREGLLAFKEKRTSNFIGV